VKKYSTKTLSTSFFSTKCRATVGSRWKQQIEAADKKWQTTGSKQQTAGSMELVGTVDSISHAVHSKQHETQSRKKTADSSQQVACIRKQAEKQEAAFRRQEACSTVCSSKQAEDKWQHVADSRALAEGENK